MVETKFEILNFTRDSNGISWKNNKNSITAIPKPPLLPYSPAAAMPC